MKQGSSEEKTLLAGMRKGDSAAYTLLVDRYGGKIHGLARRYAATETDAEDITQETLIEICRSIHSFRGEAALSTFIYRIAINRCLKYRERLQRQPSGGVSVEMLEVASDERQDPIHAAARNELAEQVHTALDSLSDGHREVVILHEMHGLTYAECAQVLQVPIGTVKSRLFNAFGRLRERLAGYMRGEESPTGVRAGEKEITPATVAGVALNGGTGGGR